MSAISELSQIKVDKARTPEEKRARRKEAGRDNKAGYLFLLPWLIGLVVITIGPMLASLYLSFTRYSLIQAPEWIGIDNYIRMLSDARLHQSLKVTFTYVIVGVPLQLIVALAIAILLNEGMKGLAFYRSVFYLPSMLGASVAIAVLWRQMFGIDGLVNQVLRAVGIDSQIGWISDPGLGPVVAGPAARVDLRLADGDLPRRAAADPRPCTTRRPRWTGPAGGPASPRSPCRCCHRSSSSTWCCRSSVRSSRSPRPSWSRTAPVARRTRPCSSPLYLYQRGFGQFQMGYAAAMAWLLVVIVGAFTASTSSLSKYWVFYDD